jgi:cyanophycinase
VLVVPAAGGSPVKSAAYFTAQMERAGVPRARVRVFPVAVMDDVSTPAVDESSWSGNASRTELLEGLGNLAGVWFTGGDQLRIVRTLRDPAGKDTPLLALVRARHAAGAVIGGSSAGAAIMSEHMIGGGESFRALLEPLASSEAEIDEEGTGRLYLARGLGFFAGGLVDQHFDRQARLGRLVRALGETGVKRGFGIDEDTALVVAPDRASAQVLGEGGVTVLDTRAARFDFAGEALARGLELALFPRGVSFALDTLAPLAGHGDPTVGNEQYRHRPLDGGGMAFANARLEDLLGLDLLDNSTQVALTRSSIDAAGRMLQYRFREQAGSRGWCCGDDGPDRYTVTGVRFDITRGPAR